MACAAAAVVFLAGMAARGAISAPAAPPAPSPQAERSGTAGAGPTREESGIPVGFAPSRDGARAAALTYTATVSQRALFFTPAQAEVAIRLVAADGAEAPLVNDALAQLDAARTPLATGTGTTWWVVRPLAARVEAYTADRARVSVWQVRVLSRQGVVVPQSSWITETVDLVWEHGDWRLWSTTTRPGPTPVLDGSDLPASAAALDGDLRGFTPVDAGSGSR
jgi:hypothetical protein